jgi:hypothetical protein
VSAVTTARSFLGRMFTMPAYPPDRRDLRTFRLAGLELPVRADRGRHRDDPDRHLRLPADAHPDELLRYDRNPGEQRLQALSRVILFLVVPLRSSSSASATGHDATGCSSATGAGASA